MNSIQFWVLVTLSSLVLVLLSLQAIFTVSLQHAQARLGNDQQTIQQGRVCDQHWRQVIERIAEVSQKSQDQGLKDILTRQGVTVKITPSAPSPAPSETPAPSATPAPPANP